MALQQRQGGASGRRVGLTLKRQTMPRMQAMKEVEQAKEEGSKK